MDGTILRYAQYSDAAAQDEQRGPLTQRARYAELRRVLGMQARHPEILGSPLITPSPR
jgi:hypothetical protein